MKKLCIITAALTLVALCLVLMPVKVDAANSYTINGVKVQYTDFASSPSDCWAYARNVYNKIWGEKFNSNFDDANNSLRNLSDEELTLTADHLKAYVSNAALGSCLRICNSQYLHAADNWGHSQIIVQKDSNGFTVFEGGLSSGTYRREYYYTWDEYISTDWLGGTYEYIKYIKWPSAPAYNTTLSAYLSKCTSYPTHATIKTTKTTYIKSLPCSEGTNAYSKNVETAGSGIQYEAIGLYMNTAGNFWYKVIAKNGSIGYMYSGDTTFIKENITDVVQSGMTAPTNHTAGKSYSLTGTISSTYSKINSITVYVYDSKGSAVSSVSANVTGNRYSLKGSTVDNKTKFGSLAVGTYTYVVRVFGEYSYAYDASTRDTYSFICKIYEKEFKVVSSTSCSHSYSSKITTAATCTTAGVRTYTCSKCSSSYTESIVATGHSYNSATCTKPKTCTTCGATSGSALGHSYTSKITTSATCTTAGVRTYTCSKCSSSYTESIAATGHSYSSATCTKPKTCSTCGATNGSALGHSYTKEVTIEATCTATGVITHTCSKCSHSYTLTTLAKGHDLTDATCTKPKTCAICGESIGSALGHSYTSKVTTAATCITAGVRTYTCSKCSNSYTESIAVTGHSYSAATCTTPATCTFCGATTGNLATHSYDGNMDATCNVCGEVRLVTDSNLKFAADPGLSFQECIGLQIMFKNSLASDYDKFYVEIQQNTPDGVVTSTSTGIPYNSTYRYFEQQIVSWSMTEQVTMTLYAEKNGILYKGASFTTTVKDLAMDKLATYYEAVDLKTCKALVDMLNYGAAVQTAYDHNASNLPNADLGKYAALGTSDTPSMSTANNITGTNKIKVYSANISLQDKVEFQFMVKTSDLSGKTVKATLNGANVDVAYTEYGSYTIIRVAAAAAHMRSTYTIVVNDANGNPVACTYNVSVEAYAKDKLSDEKADAFIAMMRYGDAVAAIG